MGVQGRRGDRHQFMTQVQPVALQRRVGDEAEAA